MIPIKDRRRRIIPVVNTSKRKIIDQKTVENDPIQNKSPKAIISPGSSNIPTQHHGKISPQIVSKTCQITPPSQHFISSNLQKLSPKKNPSESGENYLGLNSKLEQLSDKYKSPYRKVISYKSESSLEKDEKVLSPVINKARKNISFDKDETSSIILYNTPQRKLSEIKDNMKASSNDGKLTNKNIEEAKNFIMQQRRFPEKPSTSLDGNIRPTLERKTRNKKINARKTPDGNTKIFILSPAELKDMGINLNILDSGDERKLRKPDDKTQNSIGSEMRNDSKLRSADVKKTLLKKLNSKKKKSEDVQKSEEKVSLVPHPSVIHSSNSPAKQLETLPAESTPKTTNMETARFIKNYLIFSPKEGISNYIEGYSNINEQLPQKNSISVSTNNEKPCLNRTKLNDVVENEPSNKTTLVGSTFDDAVDIDENNFGDNISFELPDINSDDDIGIFDLSNVNLEEQNTSNSVQSDVDTVEHVSDIMKVTEITADALEPNLDHENMPPSNTEQISPSGTYKNIEILFKSLSKSIIVSENGELLPVQSSVGNQVECKQLMNLQETNFVTSTIHADSVQNTIMKTTQMHTPKLRTYQKSNNSQFSKIQKNVVFGKNDEEDGKSKKDGGTDECVFNPFRQKIKQYMSPKALKSPQPGNIQSTHGADLANNKFLKETNSKPFKELKSPVCSTTLTNYESFKGANTSACSTTPVNSASIKAVKSPVCSTTLTNYESFKGANTPTCSTTPVNSASIKAVKNPVCSITSTNDESFKGANTPACSSTLVNSASIKAVMTPACFTTPVSNEFTEEVKNSDSRIKLNVEDNFHSKTNIVQDKSNIQNSNKNLDEARMKIMEILKTFHSMPKENKFAKSHKNISSIYEDDSNGSDYEDNFSDDQLTSESFNIESNGNSDTEDSSLKIMESENNQNSPKKNEPEFVQTNSENKTVFSVLANNNSFLSENHIVESSKPNKNIQIIHVEEIKEKIIIPPLRHAEIVKTIQPAKLQDKINVRQILVEKSLVKVMEDATSIQEPILAIDFSDIHKIKHVKDSIGSHNNYRSESILDYNRVPLSIPNIEDVEYTKCDMNVNATCDENMDTSKVLLDENQINDNIRSPDKTNTESIYTDHFEKITESVLNSNPVRITELFHNQNVTSEKIISAGSDSQYDLTMIPNEDILPKNIISAEKEQSSGKTDTSEDEENLSDSLISVVQIIEEDEDDSKILNDVRPVPEMSNSIYSSEWTSTTFTNDTDILHQKAINYADATISEKDVPFVEETKVIVNQDNEKEGESVDFSDSSNTFNSDRDILNHKKMNIDHADEIIGEKYVLSVEETKVIDNQDSKKEGESVEISGSSNTFNSDRDILHYKKMNTDYADEIIGEKDVLSVEETKVVDNRDNETESESMEFSDSSNTFTNDRGILCQEMNTDYADEVIGEKYVLSVEKTKVVDNQNDSFVDSTHNTYYESCKIEEIVPDCTEDNEKCGDLTEVIEEVISTEIQDSINLTQTVSKQVEERPDIMVAQSDTSAIETAQAKNVICGEFDADQKPDVTLEDEEISMSVETHKAGVVEKSHDLNDIDSLSDDKFETSRVETRSNKRRTRKREINLEKKYVSQRLLNRNLCDDNLGGSVLSNASKRKRMSDEFEKYNHKSVKRKKADVSISSPSELSVVPETSTPILKKKTRKRIIVESDSSDEGKPLSAIIANDKQSDSGISEDVSKNLHDSGDTTADRTEKSDQLETSLNLGKDKVKCGVCSVIVKTQSWDSHSLNKHYYLAWIEGEEPLNTASGDQLYLINLLNKAIKANKKLACSLCGIKKASAVGYLTHINLCRKTPEEIEAYKTLCTVCNQRILPSSFTYHMSKHAQEELKQTVVNPVVPAVKEEKEEETLDLSKRKRRAATVAENIFKKLGREVVAEVNINVMYIKGYAPKVSKRFETIWRNQISSTKSAKCSRRQCSYNADNIEDIMNHFEKNCAYITKKPFVCKVCREEYEDQEGVEEHIRSKHPDWSKVDQDANFEESVESSESEDTEDDENISDCSNDSVPRKKKLSSLSVSAVKSNAAIGSILDGPFRFSFDEQRRSEKSLRSTITSWIKLLKETIFDGEYLFSQYPCNDYRALNDDEIESYLPDAKESCNVSHLLETSGKTQNIQWTKYTVFQSEVTNGIQTFWCGGPIYAIDFLPSLFDNAIVAISAGKSLHQRYSEIECYSHKGLIQIWDLGVLNNKNGSCLSPASMAFAIAHEHGVVWDLSWCPSGCCDYWPGDISASSRMGLLAVACSDGQAYIYAVCHPDKLSQSHCKFWKTDPVVQLCLVPNHEEESFLGRAKYQATKICWSQDGRHNIVVVGYSNGLVAYYDITTTSRLLSSQCGNTRTFQPYKTFQAQPSRITGLALLPQFDSNQGAPLAVSSFTGCSIWRGDQLTFSRPGTFDEMELPMLFPEINVFSEQIQPSYTRSYTIPLAISNGLDSKWMNTNEGCQISCLMTHSSTVYSASYQGYVCRQCHKSPCVARHRSNKCNINKKFLCWYMHAINLNTECIKLCDIKAKSRFNSRCIKEGMQDQEVLESLASYKDTTDKYGLLIVDVPQNTILQHTNFLNIPSYRMWPLWEQLCMKSLLMNEKYSNFAISGSRAGFCRIAYVPPVTI